MIHNDSYYLLVSNVAQPSHDIGLLGLVTPGHVEMDVLDLVLAR